MAHDFELTFEALFVLAEDLDVVVCEAEQPEPHGADNHQPSVDVAEVAQQQYGHEYGDEDDESAHRGGPFFLHLTIESEVADVLADLFFAEQADEFATEHHTDEQCEDDCSHGAEREVLPHTEARNVVVIFKIFY